MSQMIEGAAQQDASTGASISSLCRAAGLARSTFYLLPLAHSGNRPGSGRGGHAAARRDSAGGGGVASLRLSPGKRSAVTAHLHRQGIHANHKRVLRLLRADNLLCLRRRRFVRTTDSEHALPVYPNLATKMVLSGLDQLWVADITYIRLRSEFVYLAVVLDAFSRRCISWHLSGHLDAALTVTALERALKERQPGPGLVHHSDRGVQYAAAEYTDLLLWHGIQISMSRTGNPYDNAKAESFIKTLKYEEVYLNEYENLSDARACIGAFIEAVYNQKRLHSALGYLPPAEFEVLHRQQEQPTTP